MKKYTCLGRTLLLVSASSLAWSGVPLAFGQTPPDAAATNTQPAQTPKTPLPEKKIPVENAPKSEVSEEDVLVLSPFEVTAENNKGYFAANTMSGTRMNSKIEDLGQSITVMTKEQMADFAMRDINDVFDYMASTEGTNSYSQFTTDRTGAVVDNVSLSPNTANRVRGIGNANVAFGNFAVTGRVPIDSLWIDALELSRGPNANIFGLGNASGTVNQVPATANLTRNFTKISLRADSYEGWLTSLDVNRMLIKNKLSVRASYANQHTGFVRKPAEENARRVSFQVKAQPFRNTTLSASYFGYKNNAVRPNYTTPRDYYTDWFGQGQPSWNPVTRLVTMANGDVISNGGARNLPTPIPWTSTPSYYAGTDTRSPFQIGAPGENPYWTNARYSSATDPFLSATGIGLVATGASDTYTATQQPLYNSVARPINNKAIYDWTKINLAGNSKAWDDDKIYLIQLDQIFLNTSKQTLAFQAAYMREDAKRLENQPMGPASVNSNVGQLQVDVNKVNLDGSPNPYFGRPYLKSSEPFLRDRPSLWDNARAQAVYKIDFSKDEGWSKWLGTQQILGYYEYKDQQNRLYTYRHTATARDKAWEQKYASTLWALQTTTNTANQYLIPPTTPTGAYTIIPGNYSRLAEQYYVGSTPFGGIEYAPSAFPEGASVPYVWGAPSSTMNYDTSVVAFTPGQGGGLNNVNERVRTEGAVIQSTFLQGKLIATYGLRKDRVFDRNAPLATMTPDLRNYDFGQSNKWTHDWRLAEGKTKTFSLVAVPFRDIGALRRQVEHGSGVGKLVAEVLTSFRPTYNKSDNFIPQGPAYDLFLHQLPNQTGTSKDIGFWVTMLDGRLSIRYTKYDTKQLNLRDGDISTMAQRILRYEGFIQNDAWNLRTQVSNWLAGVASGASATDAQIAAAIKMPLEQYQGLTTIATAGTYAAVNDMVSKGQELEINFNPTKNWTVSASVTKNQSINTSAGSAVDDYIAARMPVWTTLEDPRFTPTTQTINGVTTPITPQFSIPTGATGHLLWWNIMGTPFNSATVAGYNATNSAATNFAGNVNSPMSVFRALIGRPRPQIREYNAKFNTKYDLAGLSDNTILKKTSVGGSVRYASKGSIGFYGKGYYDGMDLTLVQNRILELDTNRPIYSKAEAFVDLFVSYNTKIFHDKIRAKYQLNVKNVTENGGGLQRTQAFFDGRAATYRIVDPRQFTLTVSLDL